MTSYPAAALTLNNIIFYLSNCFIFVKSSLSLSVLVICLLYLPTLFKDKCYFLEDAIPKTTLKYSSTMVYEIVFLKLQLYMVLVLVYVHTENCKQNPFVTHHLSCLSSSFLQVMSQYNSGPNHFKICALPLQILDLSVINLLPFLS